MSRLADDRSYAADSRVRPDRDRMLGERGSGSILALGLCLAIIAMTGLSVVLLDVGRARARAQGAADFAALAGANAAIRGAPACAAAELVSAANNAQLRFCEALPDGSTVVSVSLVPQLPLTRSVTDAVTMWARAGPSG